MLLTCDPKAFPTSPGVYLMKDAQDVVLYVGKAKNLRTRLRSYLRPDGDGRPQIRFLQERTARIETIVTDTEKEALILENTLIKRYRPRYNLHLRDDKTYVSIRLDPREEFPALRVVRQPAADGALYFGPFASSAAVRETLKEIYRIFPLRHYPLATCRQRHRPCLFHQIGQCCAPCHGLISPADYAVLVQGAVALLSGRGKEVLGLLRERMQVAAEQLRFEEAARLRDQLAAISQTIEQQKVIKHGGGDCDVFGFAQDGSRYAVAVLTVRQGQLLDKRHFVVTWELTAEELVSSVIQEYYRDGQQLPPEIFTSIPLDDSLVLGEWFSERRGGKVVLSTPRRGDKLRLVELACRNAREQRPTEDADEAATADELLREVQRVLQLKKLPLRMECFDISHTHGEFTTASMAVFLRGRPSPREYRSYRIKSVTGRPDDYAAMREVLERRLARGKHQGRLPQVIMVDGGRGQLSILMSVLQAQQLEYDVEAAAIAKARAAGAAAAGGKASQDRVFRPGSEQPVALDEVPAVRNLLAHLRDEAHRFAIGQQRRKRSRELLRTQLEGIPGVGPKLRLRLLQHFGSVQAVVRATATDLAKVPGVGEQLASCITNYFMQHDQPPQP